MWCLLSLSDVKLVWPSSIDILQVIVKNYWVCCDVACGAGDSCQIIQLRKVEDTRLYCCANTDWKTDTYVKLHELLQHCDGIKMWRSSGGSSGLWERVDVLTTGLQQGQLKGWSRCGDRSHSRAGEGGSSSSLRSGGKNWSEQAGVPAA